MLTGEENKAAQAPQSGVNTDAQQFCPISIPLVSSSTPGSTQSNATLLSSMSLLAQLFLKIACFTKAQLYCEKTWNHV